MERKELRGFLKKRPFLGGIVYYTLVSLAIIFFASPLFRILGFEYSGFIAIACSIHLLYYSATLAAGKKDVDAWHIIKSIWLPVFILANVPLLISLVSALFIPNCSLWDGLIFYIEIVYPTALIAMLCGVWFAINKWPPKKRNIYIAIFWIVTLLISLLPGYFSARIYTYGWQYGYFPGFVWDEAMELSGGYWISRLIEVGVIISWLFQQSVLKHPVAVNKKMFTTWQYWLMGLANTLFGLTLSNQFFDSNLENYLKKEVTISYVHLHYRFNTFSDDELLVVKYNVHQYAKEIDSIYGLQNSSKIDIYVFLNSDDLYEYVGTREASISKPWKRSIYITKQNLNSLKHEMVHVMLSAKGKFPFDISWTTGLTEGAAVAAEDDYDGIRDCDEYAARILQMKLSGGVKNVMSFSGFASEASEKSYTLAGSFCKFMLENYGAKNFLASYHSGDFDDLYGDNALDSLEKKWIASLAPFQTGIDEFDSARIRFYFDRRSILKDPCLRRIGKLMKEANAQFAKNNYVFADSLYAVVLKESDRLDAVRGRVSCKLRMHDPDAALALLDTLLAATKTSAAAALHLLRGDVIILSKGKLSDALDEWWKALWLQLNDRTFLAAFARLYCLGNTVDTAKAEKYISLLYGEHASESAQSRIEILQNMKPQPKPASDLVFEMARNYLLYSEISSAGKLRESLKYLREIQKLLDKTEYTKHVLYLDLFEKLTDKRRKILESVFGSTQ